MKMTTSATEPSVVAGQAGSGALEGAGALEATMPRFDTQPPVPSATPVTPQPPVATVPSQPPLPPMSPAVSGPSVPPTSPEQGLAGSTGSVEPAEPADKERLPESRRSQILRSIIELVIAFVLAFGITWAIKTWVIQPYEVPSTSMEPTIMLKDRLMADSLTYAFGTIKTGDIVVFIDKTDQDRHLVKRVIAVEGQTVDFLDGRVVIDGQLLSEPYVHGKKSFPFTKTYKNTEITYPYTVPAGHIWVMGDNRENSTDSRYFGPIATDSVVGHALVKFWPPSSIGWL